MCTSASTTTPCFLVEWYQPDLAAITFDDAVDRLREVAGARQVQLLGALTAPTDDTIYGVLAGDSADHVIQTCQQAGWRTDRVTAVVRANLGV